MSFDGRSRTECVKGHSIVVSLSPYPFPCKLIKLVCLIYLALVVCKSTCETGDGWMQALTDNLNWNLRIRQQRHEASTAQELRGLSVLDYTLPQELKDWYQQHHAFQSIKPIVLHQSSRNHGINRQTTSDEDEVSSRSRSLERLAQRSTKRDQNMSSASLKDDEYSHNRPIKRAAGGISPSSSASSWPFVKPVGKRHGAIALAPNKKPPEMIKTNN